MSDFTTDELASLDTAQSVINAGITYVKGAPVALWRPGDATIEADCNSYAISKLVYLRERCGWPASELFLSECATQGTTRNHAVLMVRRDGAVPRILSNGIDFVCPLDQEPCSLWTAWAYFEHGTNATLLREFSYV